MSKTFAQYALFALTILVPGLLWPPAICAAEDPENGVDARIRPGDDFFAYANGTWLATTTIPEKASRWTARSEIDQRTRQQVDALLVDAPNALPGSLARKLGDYLLAYADDRQIEAGGFAPVRPLLAEIDAIQDRTSLANYLGHQLLADADPINQGTWDSAGSFGIAVCPGMHAEADNVVFLSQGGLGMTTPERYVDGSAEAAALRTRYQAYLQQLLQGAGFDQPAARAARAFALEMELAKTHASRKDSEPDSNADNLWTTADFPRRAPGLDWRAFLVAAGLGAQPGIVVWQPSAAQGLAALAGSEPLDAWRDYLRARVLDRYAELLPDSAANGAVAFHAALRGEPAVTLSRRARSGDTARGAMSEVIARLYVDRWFPADYRRRVATIVRDVIDAFSERLDHVTWLEPESRALARGKLKTLYSGIGYSEHWPDYSSLTIDAHDALGNQRRIESWTLRNVMLRVGQSADPTQWQMTPQTVGAVLLFNQNAYNFPAALLQAPKFDPQAPDAANYGAIGAIVGHEISHYFDTLGADYDARGGKAHWWTARDLAGYREATAPLVAQYSAYLPAPDLRVDGERTLVENLADLGGLVAAFDAHRRALGTRVRDRAWIRQQDRQFFLGFARGWRSLYRDEALRKYVATDPHAPDNFRIATVRNLDAWYQAFDVQPEDRLYLPPPARVRIW